MKHYQHSAAAGNRHAKERVHIVEQEMAGTVAAEVQSRRLMQRNMRGNCHGGRHMLLEVQGALLYRGHCQ